MDDRTRLEKKLQRNPAAILRADEVAVLAGEARRMLGSQLTPLLAVASVGFEDVLRWGSLKARCEQVRAHRGTDIKKAAAEAGIPQYRVKAIENGHLGELRPELAWKYFGFLGISSWVRTWIRLNRDLATRAGIAAHQGASGASRKSNNAMQRPGPHVTALAEKRKGRAMRPRR